RVKIVPFEFPGPTIEITSASERPPGPGRVPAAQVWASVEDGQPVLRGPDRGPLLLANGELHTLAHAIFAPPRVVPPLLDLGPHTPRITSGDVVVQRERWKLRRRDLLPGRYQGASFELMADFR